MSAKPEQQVVAEKLQDALDRLQNDVKRVEIWAGALTGFAQPIPDYQASSDQYRMGRESGDRDGAAADGAPAATRSEPR